MNPRTKKIAITLLTMVVLFDLVVTNAKLAISAAQSGNIDLYTQKEPYSGKGQNVQSDAFGPWEQVQVFALVTYNDAPVVHLLVAFEFTGPRNSIENITISRSGFTNSDGIATASVRISNVNESTFGMWAVIGNVKIADTSYQDTLTFKVGWIVEIVSLKTVNSDYEYQESFGVGGVVGLEVGVTCIAMTAKVATLTIAIYDSMGSYVSSTGLDGFFVPPNMTLVRVYFFLRIPENTTDGKAVVYANAYTAPVDMGGVPYCPEVSASFWVSNHDVAVENVIPSSAYVYVGDIAEVQVAVRNQGAYPESFTVTAFYNSSVIGFFPLENVDAGDRLTIYFRFSTQGLALGNYTLSAEVSQVPGEENLDNNRFVDGTLEIRATPSALHDVAVVDVVPAARLVYVGDVVSVNVTVKNKGLENESFNVLVYYSGNPIGPALRVYNLAPGTEYTLAFQWNTYRVLPGNYTLAGYAEPVLGEVNTADNIYFDGEVRVARSPGGVFIMDWFGWALLLFFLLLLLLLILWLLRRRRKKEEATFYAGWTAWYYGYDLRTKPRDA